MVKNYALLNDITTVINSFNYTVSESLALVNLNKIHGNLVPGPAT
jgi:hypothetical protein